MNKIFFSKFTLHGPSIASFCSKKLTKLDSLCPPTHISRLLPASALRTYCLIRHYHRSYSNFMKIKFHYFV